MSRSFHGRLLFSALAFNFVAGLTESEAAGIDSTKLFFTENDPAAQANPATFDGGTLKPTTSFTFGQPFSITPNGGTVDDTNGTITFSNVLSGPGHLNIQGVGNVVLQGSNNYSGGTTILSGTLTLQTTVAGNVATGALPNATGTILNQGTLVVDGGIVLDSNSNTIPTPFAASVSGTGGVRTQGFVKFTGHNTYSGDTTVVAVGELVAGAANTFSPNSRINAGQSTAVSIGDFDQTVASISAPSTNSGGVRLGAGTLTMGADNSSTTIALISGGPGGIVKSARGR